MNNIEIEAMGLAVGERIVVYCDEIRAKKVGRFDIQNGKALAWTEDAPFPILLASPVVSRVERVDDGA